MVDCPYGCKDCEGETCMVCKTGFKLENNKCEKE